MVAKIQISAETAFEEAQRGLDKLSASVAKTGKNAEMGSSGFKTFGASIDNVNEPVLGFAGAMGIAGAAIGAGTLLLKDAADVTIKYAEQVRDLGRISGASAEETSKLIQVSDDLKVSYETLTQASKALAQDGIALTTEELAKASDQYLSFADAASRSEYAVKTFGRSGLEMTKVLEMGGDALRKLAAEQSGNLILTAEQVAAARKWEIAQDNLNDTLDGLRIVIGNKVLPVMTGFLKAVDDLINGSQRASDAFEDEKKNVLLTAGSYQDYIIKMIVARSEAQKIPRTYEEVKKSLDAVDDGYQRAVNGADILTEAGYEQAIAFAKNTEQIRLYGDASQGAMEQTDDFTAALKRSNEVTISSLKSGMSLKTFIDGNAKSWDAAAEKVSDYEGQIAELQKLKVLSPEEWSNVNNLWKSWSNAKESLGKYAEMTDTERKKAMQDAQNKIWNITTGSYLTDEQKGQLDTLRTKLGEAKKAQEALALATAAASKKMVFDMLWAKAEAGGFAGESSTNLMNLAVAFGYVDQKAVTMAASLNGMDLSKAKMSIIDIYLAVQALMQQPSSKDIYVTAHYNREDDGYTPRRLGGDQGYASGGSYVIPPGYYENYPVGLGKVASSGETVTITPANGGGSGGNSDLVNAISSLPALIRDAILQVAR